MMSPRLLLTGLLLNVFPAFARADEIDFNRDIRPILTENCFACHGPDEKKRKADLRLDIRADALSFGAFVPGKPAQSGLIKRVTATDPGEVMPPPATGKKLTPQQVQTLRKWIADGAHTRSTGRSCRRCGPRCPASARSDTRSATRSTHSSPIGS